MKLTRSITSTATQQLILRANALYIGVAGATSILLDLRGAWYGLGPQGRILAGVPHAAIGFVEAHGLAVILAVLLWRAVPSRSWHLTAAVMVALLGTSNLVFWAVRARHYHGGSVMWRNSLRKGSFAAKSSSPLPSN